MTKLFLIIFGLMLVYFPAISQTIYRAYKPIQDNLVGWTVNYNKSTLELSKKQNKLDSMITSNSVENYDQYTKSANIDVIAMNRKVGKITTIKAMGNVYIDQAYNLKPPALENVTFVYSAIRADSFNLTYVKDASTNINPMQLIQGIASTLGVDMAWMKVNWVDSVTHTFKDSLSITVKNSSAYYLAELAKLKYPGINLRNMSWAQRKLHPEWFRTFNGDNAFDQHPIYLTPDSDSSSVSKETVGVQPNCKVTIFVDKDDNGKLLLKAITNFDSYKAFIIKPNIGNSWDITDFSLGLYNVASNNYVELKIDLKARLVGNSIKITESYFTYPLYKISHLQ
jgi:hypothetical protein